VEELLDHVAVRIPPPFGSLHPIPRRMRPDAGPRSHTLHPEADRVAVARRIRDHVANLPPLAIAPICPGKGSLVTKDGRSIVDLLGVVGLKELLPDE
jgi:hypothetical protein